MKDVLLVLISIIVGVLGTVRFKQFRNSKLRDADRGADEKLASETHQATRDHDEQAEAIQKDVAAVRDLPVSDLASEFDSAFTTLSEDDPASEGGP